VDSICGIDEGGDYSFCKNFPRKINHLVQGGENFCEKYFVSCE